MANPQITVLMSVEKYVREAIDRILNPYKILKVPQSAPKV